MTGQQLSFGRDENWRKKCKAFLLQKTLEMNQAPVDGDAYQLVFRDLYNKQADLSGSPAPSGAAKATDLLEQLLQTKGQKLAALPVKNISAAAEKYVSDIPHRLTAIGYLAQNDLQKMVLLLRMHMKLLAVEVALAHANKAEFAENLCLELDSKCREQPNAVAQMWYCDHYLLRLWVLHLDDSMQIVKKSE